MILNGIPTKEKAIELIKEAQKLNPTPWVQHSYHVAESASIIAKELGLKEEVAYILGLLHDIGRRYGRNGMRHSIEGYRYLEKLGYDKPAKVCISHCAFMYQDKYRIVGEWNGTKEEMDFMLDYLNNHTLDLYDNLIHLCDYISLPSGFCILEKRLVDMALRKGFNDLTIPRWKSTFKIKEKIENRINKSIYDLLPNVIDNSFT